MVHRWKATSLSGRNQSEVAEARYCCLLRDPTRYVTRLVTVEVRLRLREKLVLRLHLWLHTNSSFPSMDTHITRKRSRSEEDESALPPAKRESDPDNSESVVAATGGSARQADHRKGDGHDIERDEEFWFDDGTVILVASDVEFRFYKGLLASVSPVFKQLFADSRVVRTVPMDEEQTFSCPVVHVSDSPKELRYVLRTCSSKRPDRCVMLSGRVCCCTVKSDLMRWFTGCTKSENRPTRRYPPQFASDASTR